MLEQHEIEHLLAIGERQRQELMGIGLPAKTPGSEPGEVEAASASPTIDGEFSSGLDAGL